MKFLRTAVLICALSAAAFTVKAGLQIDPVLNGGTNYCPAATTNTYNSSPFYTGRSSQVWLEAEFVCTNTSKMKVGDGPTITFNVSQNSDTYITNAFSIVVPAVGANGTATTLTNLSAANWSFPYIQTYQVWNTNVSGTNFSTLKVRVFTKDGI